MKVTLVNNKGQKVSVNRGFSIKFFFLGSLNYLFSGRIVKAILAWIWYVITLVWLLPKNWIDDAYINVVEKLASWIKGDIGNKLIESIDTFVNTVNDEIFPKNDYKLTYLAVLGVILFIIVRVISALLYNGSMIRFYRRKGYVVEGTQQDTPASVENVPYAPAFPNERPKFEEQPASAPVPPVQPIAAAPVIEEQEVTPAIQPLPFHFQAHNTRAQVRSMENKRQVELRLLKEAYDAGMISYEVYLAKKQILEGQ